MCAKSAKNVQKSLPKAKKPEITSKSQKKSKNEPKN